LSDFLLFTSSDPARATMAVRLSLTSINLAELFFLLFTIVYVGRMTRAHWLLAIISAGLILMTWTLMPQSLEQGELFLPIFSASAFSIFIVYVLAYGIAGVRNLYRVYRIVKEQSRRLARRAAGLVVTFSMVLVFGLLTNGYLGLTQNKDIPPPFSTLLSIVAVMAAYTLYPGGRERISEAIRKFRARRYDIKSAFLVFHDGTLIGSFVKEPGTTIDQDLLAATLDVIQNFMRTSFPILQGTSLKTIEHGSLKIIIERGRRCYLTVVLEGEENDLLRRQMRDEVLAFESANDQVLRDWRGVPEEALGADQMFKRVLQPVELFGA
ncbi:MAG TPA: hypothetical protein VIL58_07360, partial [Thermoplasmata archaeon]